MTTRLCFIGNSHLGALYKSWKAIQHHYSDIEIDFFIKRSTGTKALQIFSDYDGEQRTTILDEILVVKEDCIDVSAYNAFFVCSLGFSAVRAAKLYKMYRADDHQWTGTESLVSDEFFLTAMIGALKESNAVKIVDALRSHSNKPIHLLAEPRLSESVVGDPEKRLSYYTNPILAGDDQSLETFYLRAAQTVCLAYNINLIDQPKVTRASPLLTIGAFGLADPDDQNEGSYFAIGDFWHMNETYGLLSLSSALSAVGCIQIDPAAITKYQEILHGKRSEVNGYVFNPAKEFGIIDEPCRLVIYDNIEEKFYSITEIKSNKEKVVGFHEIPSHMNCKFKIQTKKDGQWSDFVKYTPLIPPHKK